MGALETPYYNDQNRIYSEMLKRDAFQNQDPRDRSMVALTNKGAIPSFPDYSTRNPEGTLSKKTADITLQSMKNIWPNIKPKTTDSTNPPASEWRGGIAPSPSDLGQVIQPASYQIIAGGLNKFGEQRLPMDTTALRNRSDWSKGSQNYIANENNSNYEDQVKDAKRKQAALDISTALSETSRPWWAGGTADSQQAGVNRYSAIQKRLALEQKDNEIMSALAGHKYTADQGLRGHEVTARQSALPKILSPEEKAQMVAHTNLFNAQTAALPTRDQQAHEKLQANRDNTLAKMIEQANRLPDETQRQAALDDAYAWSNNQRRVKISDEVPAKSGILGFGSTPKKEATYGYKPIDPIKSALEAGYTKEQIDAYLKSKGRS